MTAAVSAESKIEHLDVLVVGAGLSGIAAGHHLQTTTPWASYAIFEARESIGGTWDLFRYPGIRSDSDMFTLGFPFRPWTGEQSIADGPDILQYIKDTAAEEGIDDHIRFSHKIVTANWSTEEARWHIVAERVGHNGESGELFELTCGFLFTCTGYYRYDHGYTPEFEGIDDFDGQVIHPQEWPEDFDASGKRVVVIGSGATAVTLIPSLADQAEHVTMLQRSPSYIAAVPRKSPIATGLQKVLPSGVAATTMRWLAALGTHAFFLFCRRFPQAARRLLRKGTEMALPDGYDIDPHFTPKYDPWDQRLCADPEAKFFRAIKKGTASVETDTIDTFTSGGIRLDSGRELPADVVITATGLELLFIGGIEVCVDGQPLDLPSKLTYKGMMLEGVPNMAMAIGYTNASWTLKADLTCDYVARLINEMRARGQAQCVPVNNGASVSPDPLLGLTSGYLKRSSDRFPRQGDTPPWRVRQSYVRDYQALKRSPVVDQGLVLSNPSPVDRPAMVAAG